MEAGHPWYSWEGEAFCHSKRESSQPADVLPFSSAYLHAVEGAQKRGGTSTCCRLLLEFDFIPFFLFSTWISNASQARSIVICGDKRIDDTLPLAGVGRGDGGGSHGGETPQWQLQKNNKTGLAANLRGRTNMFLSWSSPCNYALYWSPSINWLLSWILNHCIAEWAPQLVGSSSSLGSS